MTKAENLESGRDVRRDVQGPKSELIQASVEELDAGLAQWVDDFVFGAVWGREGLSREERIMVAISVLASSRNYEQLKAYLFGALHKGVSARKIQEIFTMLTVYRGFPIAIQGLSVWHDVVISARKQGLEVDLSK